MFFKRLSRSRSNSQSYVDGYDSRHDSKTNSQSYDDARAFAADKYGGDNGNHNNADRGLDSRQSDQQAPQLNDPIGKDTGTGMYPRQGQPTEVVSPQSMGGAYASPPMSAGGPRRDGSGGLSNGYGSGAPPQRTSGQNMDAAPDLLMQAFNTALRPYHDKVDTLETEVADLRAYIDRLEQQQADVHAWIDKRGLRPGMFIP